MKQRTVQEAFTNRAWVSDIQGALTVGVIVEYLHLWDLLNDLELQPEVEDSYVEDSTPRNLFMRVFSWDLRI